MSHGYTVVVERTACSDQAGKALVGLLCAYYAAKQWRLPREGWPLIEGMLIEGTMFERILIEGTLTGGMMFEGTLIEGMLIEGTLIERMLTEGTLIEGTGSRSQLQVNVLENKGNPNKVYVLS